MGFRIEPSIIDGYIEKNSLYTNKDTEDLQDKLDTINYQLEMINFQLEGLELDTERRVELKMQQESLEGEKLIIVQKLKKTKEPELESADSFRGALDALELEPEEELFSARDIGKTTVPKTTTLSREEARKFDDSLFRTDPELNAQEINDEFKEKAESMISRLDDLFK